MLRRTLLAGLVPVLLLAAAPAAAGAAEPPPARLDPAVLATLASHRAVDVFVLLKQKADLSGGSSLRTHEAKAAHGFRELTATAERSQSGLRAFLRRSNADFTPFWLVNTVLVRGAGPDLVKTLATRSDVARVRPVGTVTIPEPDRTARATALAAGVEWGVDRIGAPRVWSGLGVRGEGVVVATIDSGVEFDHPALAAGYRGRKADGTYDHNYNWFDPSHVCGVPSVRPCDNNGHGTHTMGTIVGDGGAGNHIGVAPGATWISAKGCATSTCYEADLLAAGQWMLAPTDLNGENPRPELAPHIVSNSWGGSPGDPFYQDIVNAWTQSGIFPVFAAGNSGPSCATAGSPGEYDSAYAVGAFGSDGEIADFSSRGDPATTRVKPDITAPGVAVRSAVPGGGYQAMSGTSMATPHVAGAVALAWSAAPALRGDVAATRRLLDETAEDVQDFTCGGTSDDNRVWGQGRLDAFAAATFAPRGQRGTLTGTVTDVDGGRVPNPSVTVTASGAHRTFTGAADGTFSLPVAPGTYDVTATAFGFAPATANVTVAPGGTTARNLTLSAVRRYDVYGEVHQTGGEPLPGAVVSIENTPYTPVTTGSDGAFAMLGVPVGTWRVNVRGARCGASTTVTLVVDSDEILTIDTPLRKDGFGNKCDVLSSLTWVNGTTPLALTGDDKGVAVTLPFTFPLYGRPYTKAWVSTNGILNFQRDVNLAANGPIPSPGSPNAALYPFWDDLLVDASASVLTTTLGTAPNRRFVVEWRNVTLVSQPSARLTFSAELHENGQVLFQYKSMTAGQAPRGSSATVGMENGTGLIGFDYSVNQPNLRPGMGIRFYGAGIVQGVIRNPQGTALTQIPVSLWGDIGGTRTQINEVMTDASGVYRLYAPPADYRIVISTTDWEYTRKDVSITAEGQVQNIDFTLYPTENTITGHVRDSTGAPMAGVAVAVEDSGVAPATTDATGAYTLTGVRGGAQWIQVFRQACDILVQRRLTVTGDIEADLTQGMPIDHSGWACARTAKAYVEGVDPLDVTESTSAWAPLPFSFPLSDKTFTTVGVAAAGTLLFFDTTTFQWAWIAPLNADLKVDEQASVRTAVLGQGADQRFVVEWHNLKVADTGARVTFEAVLHPDGRLLFQYDDLPGDPAIRVIGENVLLASTWNSDILMIRGELSPETAFAIRPARPAL